MKNRILVALGASAVLALPAALCPSVVWAQSAASQAPTWLLDRKGAEGVGIRAGNFEIHPGVGVEGGYDSNFFRRSSTVDPTIANSPPNAPVEASGRLRVTPSISLATIGARRLSDGQGTVRPTAHFDLQADASYLEFFGSNTLQRNRNVSANGRAVLQLFPGRPVGFDVDLKYTRLINPEIITGDANLAFNQDRLAAGGEFVFRPGGGALELRAGYRFNANIFAQQSGFTNIAHAAVVRSRWRFTPRTSLLSEVDMQWLNYTSRGAAQAVLLNGTPVRAKAGFDGLVTDRLGLQVLAGYGGSLFDAQYAILRQFSSVIGSARLTWFAVGGPADPRGTLAAEATLGYSRDFAPNLLGNYIQFDRPYLEFKANFSSRFVATLTGGLAVVSYPDLPQLANPNVLRQAAFTNFRPDVTGLLEYRLTDTIALNATAIYSQNISDVILQDPSTGLGFDLAWSRFEAYGGVRWFL